MNEALKRWNFLTVRETKLRSNFLERYHIECGWAVLQWHCCHARACLCTHWSWPLPACMSAFQPALGHAPLPLAGGVTAGLRATTSSPAHMEMAAMLASPQASLSFLPSLLVMDSCSVVATRTQAPSFSKIKHCYCIIARNLPILETGKRN